MKNLLRIIGWIGLGKVYLMLIAILVLLMLGLIPVITEIISGKTNPAEPIFDLFRWV